VGGEEKAESGGEIVITVRGAADLPRMESVGVDRSTSAFCVVTFQGAQGTSYIRKHDCNPQWDETFSFPLPADCTAAPPSDGVSERVGTCWNVFGRCLKRV